MDTYTTLLERALDSQKRLNEQLLLENARLRGLALQQVDLSLGLVLKHSAIIGTLQTQNEEMQAVIDEIISPLETTI